MKPSRAANSRAAATTPSRSSFPRHSSRARTFRLRFTYAGSVLSDAGGGLLYVGARGTWYPNRGICHGQLRSHIPFSAALVADRHRQAGLAGAGRGGFVGHWISEQPIPIAGFNLGEYVRSTAKSNDIVVDAYAARGTESQTVDAQRCATHRSPLLSPHAPGTVEPVPMPPPLQNPAGIGQSLAERAAETLNALSQMLGPYAFSTLSLTENPSAESQGWPGLIFLSSYAYLQPEQLQAMNLVAGRRHHLQRSHDAARADASVVRRQGFLGQLSRAVAAGGAGQLLLAAAAGALRIRPTSSSRWRTIAQILASRSQEGRRIVEAGPVTLGSRLSSSHFPNGTRSSPMAAAPG